MSIKIMTKVWDCEDEWLKGSRRLVLLALADNANDEGYCWPSIDTIAKKVNLYRRYVISILSELEKRKYIERQQREGTSTLYRFEMKNGGVLPAALGSAPRSTGGVLPATPEPSLNHQEPSTIQFPISDEIGQSNISCESSQDKTVSLGGRKTCPPIPPPEERIDYPVIDEAARQGVGVDELCPNSPGSELLFAKLGREAKARGRRAPKRFSSIAQRDAFLEIEKKIGGDLEKAIDYVLRQGITSIKGIVNYLAKWGTQSSNGYRNKDQPVPNQRGVLKNPDGSFYA